MSSNAPDPLSSEFDIRPAWRLDDPQLEADAIDFWRRLHILPGETSPEKRAKELVAAAYKDGKLVAVTTAAISRLDFLKARFAMIRAAVDPDFRRTHAATDLAYFTRNLLEAWAAENPSERLAGMGAIVEAKELTEISRMPVWPASRLGLVGHTANGRQIRVYWFEDHRLD